ncbi:MAG: hypothetical protein K8H84_07630 [Sulfuricella denitrificans]|nr:hypothetical protein [Sulfuricella denitrificans]
MVFYPFQRGYSKLSALQSRHRTELLADVTEIRGFMPLLMKQRNGFNWSNHDRRLIRKQMSSLGRLSPYVVVILLPGGLLLLPLLAWWLDRRRLKRQSDEKADEME